MIAVSCRVNYTDIHSGRYLVLAYEVTSHIFPTNIGELFRTQASLQGSYFKAMTRVSTHSEAILALDGSKREQEICNRKFERLERASTDLHICIARFGAIFKLAYTFGCSSWISTCVMIPIISRNSAGGVGLRSEVGAILYGMDVMTETLIANGCILTMHCKSVALQCVPSS